jgi:hypothetical protein
MAYGQPPTPQSNQPQTPPPAAYQQPAAQPGYQQQRYPVPPVAQATSRPGGFKRLIPGLMVIALAIVLVVVGLVLAGKAPTAQVPTTSDVKSSLDSAKATFDANNSTTGSAVQQQVANGWYTNDLLIITAESIDKVNANQVAFVEAQQKILDSNSKLSLVIVLSIGIMLAAFGAYFVLSKWLGNE